MNNQPEKPWIKGVNAKYAMFRLEVDICVTSDQEVFSEQRPQEKMDMDTMSSLYSYGEQQTIFGLLTETLRRETFFEILIRLSDNPKFLQEYLEQDEESRAITEGTIAEDVIELLSRTIEKMAPDVARSILKMMDQKQQVEDPLCIKEEKEKPLA